MNAFTNDLTKMRILFFGVSTFEKPSANHAPLFTIPEVSLDISGTKVITAPYTGSVFEDAYTLVFQNTIGSMQDAIDAAAAGGSLENLADTTLTGPLTAGQHLTYDTATSKWVNSNPVMMVGELNDLTDVTVVGATEGQHLVLNGSSQWVAKTVAEGKESYSDFVYLTAIPPSGSDMENDEIIIDFQSGVAQNKKNFADGGYARLSFQDGAANPFATLPTEKVLLTFNTKSEAAPPMIDNSHSTIQMLVDGSSGPHPPDNAEVMR